MKLKISPSIFYSLVLAVGTFYTLTGQNEVDLTTSYRFNLPVLNPGAPHYLGIDTYNNRTLAISLSRRSWGSEIFKGNLGPKMSNLRIEWRPSGAPRFRLGGFVHQLKAGHLTNLRLTLNASYAIPLNVDGSSYISGGLNFIHSDLNISLSDVTWVDPIAAGSLSDGDRFDDVHWDGSVGVFANVEDRFYIGISIPNFKYSNNNNIFSPAELSTPIYLLTGLSFWFWDDWFRADFYTWLRKHGQRDFNNNRYSAEFDVRGSFNLNGTSLWASAGYSTTKVGHLKIGVSVGELFTSNPNNRIINGAGPNEYAFAFSWDVNMDKLRNGLENIVEFSLLITIP